MHDLTVQKGSNLTQISGQDFNNQLISLWLHRYKSKHTRRAYYRDIGLFLTFIGDRPLSTATYADLQGFEDSLASGRLAPATINRKIHALRSLLTFGAEKVRMLPTNVGVVLESQKVKDDLAQRILSEEQVFKMFALEADPRNLQIIRFLYYTGCRVSEVCSLRWRDLQPRGDREGQVTVYGKGGKTRVVLLPEKIWRSLQDLKGTAALSDPIFISAKGGHLDPSQVFRIVQAAAARAGIEGKVSPHWLRHSHASHSMDRGAPLHVVQASLGHSNPATTGRYLHARPGDGSGRYLG
ncbi:tyrosine-type recombinase/integrase [Candidatus Woesearchaeota archaeon]|nr:tyrosine-type recombinase/integrase [Candidatus Woesearchaeota archaeon]